MLPVLWFGVAAAAVRPMVDPATPAAAAVRPMVDPATPAANRTSVDSRGNALSLVFSDEFETAGRMFGAGADPYWEALDHYNPTTNDLEYYAASAVTTVGGKLTITASNTPHAPQQYTSGMLTSWNQMCFTGGVVDVSVQLPGEPLVQGFWPAVWMMGSSAGLACRL